MDFTREPVIETIITPRDGFRLVIRKSCQAGEEFVVDAVEVRGCTLVGVAVVKVVVVIAGTVAAQHFPLLVFQSNLAQSDYYH